jgi:sulfite exporter TauE/SafE
MFLLAAISLGFLGSFHCIGMCGPIAMTIPVKRTSHFSIISGSLIYNAGRILTYACLGLLFGILGKGFMLAGWQSFLSIALGISILLLLFIPNLSVIPVHVGFLVSFIGKLKLKIRSLFGVHTNRSLFIIGLLNGLLPCGLVYLGIIGALSTGDTLKGALFMIGFGLGTLPAMLSITFIRDYIGIRFRNGVRRMVPVFVAMMAVMLILRGMNLGIPYVSPTAASNAGVKCHVCCKPTK